MVSITHSPLSIVPSTLSSKSVRAKKKTKTSSTNQAQASNQIHTTSSTHTTPVISNPTEVATAVTAQLSALGSTQHGTIGYDLPQGRARQALLTYHNVMNQAQKERLSAMLGVDFYI